MAITHLEIEAPKPIPSGPRRGQFNGGLLSSVPVLTPSQLTDADGTPLIPGGWVGGISYVPQDCGAGGVYPNDCIPVGLATSNPHKTFPFDRTPIEWLPYLIYGSYNKSSFCPVQEGEQRSLDQLMMCQSKMIETELWTGQIGGPAGAININPQSVGFSPNLGLADPTALFPTNQADVTDWTGAVPVDPISGFAEIMNSIGRCGCSSVKYIHVPFGLETFWWNANLIEKDDNGVIRTKTGGHIVVPGEGYPGSAPDNGVVSGISWVYVTSTMNVILGDVEAAGQEEPLPGNRSGQSLVQNHSWYVAERYALAHWDRCCHIGIPILTCAPGQCPDPVPVVTGGAPLPVLNNDWLAEGSATPFENVDGSTSFGIRSTNPPQPPLL